MNQREKERASERKNKKNECSIEFVLWMLVLSGKNHLPRILINCSYEFMTVNNNEYEFVVFISILSNKFGTLIMVFFFVVVNFNFCWQSHLKLEHSAAIEWIPLRKTKLFELNCCEKKKIKIFYWMKCYRFIPNAPQHTSTSWRGKRVCIRKIKVVNIVILL